VILDLHALPFPAAIEAGDRPLASPLARTQIEAGQTNLFTLNQRAMAFSDPGPRAFLALLDGSRDRAQLEADWAETEFGKQVSVEDALSQLGRAGMLLA
jgi:hypothetical protein